MLSEVDRRWKKSPKGIESRRKYDRSEIGKAKYKRYRSTIKYKKYIRKYYWSLPEDIRKARYYVHNAVRDGRLIKPKKCEECNKKDRGIGRSMIEAHHYMGYEPQYRLTVKWLCTDCHKKADLKEVVSNE